MNLMIKEPTSVGPLQRGFDTRYDSNQPAQPQMLARILKFCMLQVQISYFPESEQ